MYGKKKFRKILLIAFAILIAYFLFNNYYGEDKMIESKYNKVMVLGIDGMDYKITKSLLASGQLPNFAKLATFKKLDTATPPESPVAWVSIATGLNPGKHNIFDFIRRDPEVQLPELSLSKAKQGIGGTNYETYVKGIPFWKLTSKAGLETTVIRWPVTFPPDKVSGKMFSGLGVPDIKGFLSGYTFYSTQDQKDLDKGKLVKVKPLNGIINTEVSGPKIRKGGDIIDVKVPMQIKIDGDEAVITIDGKDYKAKKQEWSGWLKADFKVGLLKKISGIFKVYISDTEPFEMYLTTVQVDPQDPVVKISYPSSYSEDLAQEIGPYYTLGMPEETDGYVSEVLDKKAFLEQTQEIEDERDKMFWKEFNQFKEQEKGVFAFVYDTSDRLQHLFWDEKVLTEDDNKISLNKVVLDYYLEKDQFLGKVMRELSDDTLLLIISDHGITSFERAINMNNWLVENGFMVLKEPLNGEESPLFQKVDWTKTKAYSLGFTSIYVNLKGREVHGTVENKEPVVEEITEKLSKLVDSENSKQVVHRIYRSEEIYSGEFLKNSPDLIVGFNPGFRMSWQTAIGGFGEEVIIDNLKRWSGDHLVDPSFVPGVVFSNKELREKEANLIDIAPTILEALGVPLPTEIDGGSLLK